MAVTQIKGMPQGPILQLRRVLLLEHSSLTGMWRSTHPWHQAHLRLEFNFRIPQTIVASVDRALLQHPSVKVVGHPLRNLCQTVVAHPSRRNIRDETGDNFWILLALSGVWSGFEFWRIMEIPIRSSVWLALVGGKLLQVCTVLSWNKAMRKSRLYFDYIFSAYDDRMGSYFL